MKKNLIYILLIYVIDLVLSCIDFSFLYQSKGAARVMEWLDPNYTIEFLLVGLIGCLLICRQPLHEFSRNVIKKESLIVILVNLVFVFTIACAGALIGKYNVNWIAVLKQAVFFLISVGLTEEWIYRGFMITQLSKVLSSKFAVVFLSAVLFSMMHLPYFFLHSDSIDILSVGYRLLIPFLLGLVFGAIYLWKKNLLSLVSIHCVYDLISSITMGSWYYVAYAIYWILLIGYMIFCYKTIQEVSDETTNY